MFWCNRKINQRLDDIDRRLVAYGQQLNVIALSMAKLIGKVDKIMASQAELTVQVTAANDKLKKISTETSSLLVKIEELTAAINDSPQVTPELQAAVDALTAQADVVDALVPDVV